METSFILTQILVHLHVNKTYFPYERLRSGTRFETEAKGNSEIAHSSRPTTRAKDHGFLKS